MGIDRSPAYNEYFYYKLDFLANQNAWQPYLLYDPKGHGDLCGRFDLVYDPNMSGGH